MKIAGELKDPNPGVQGGRVPDPQVLRLQRELKALSTALRKPEWDPGKLDGKFGSDTTKALESFAKWRNKGEPIPTESWMTCLPLT